MNRIARLKANAKARKDPFNKATRAPAKRVAPALCPRGRCEHQGMWHDETGKCIAPGCRCGEEVSPDEDPEAVE